MSSVRVAVRARPLNKRELDVDSKCIIEMHDRKTIITTDKSTALDEKKVFSKEFTYDYSYWSADSRDSHYVNQEQVFEDLGEDVLKSAFQGYNACIFAYGQTGSGKSYTMMGVPGASGLIPRICEALYDRIGKEDNKNSSYKTEVSYMEIYNERVRDLLRPASSKQLHNLRVREHPTEGPYVESLTKHLVSDYNALFELMELGNTHSDGATKMNDVSSRSHAIFTISFTQATFDSNLPSETASRINLVDLAGSERAAATGATGDRLKEGGNINRSLVTLGNVISALAKMSMQQSARDKKTFIPYRDSVLTWLLKESLGGNSKTVMVATISPADVNYGETLSTLQYANRAKNIINKPTVNEDPNVKLIRELRAEITRLREVIANSQMVGATPAIAELEASENLHRKEEQVAALTRSWTGKWFELHKIAKEHELALRSEGIKMTVGSELPHLIAMDNDILSAGVVIYHLQMGNTSIGTNGCDIDLAGPGLMEQHCTVDHVDGVVMFHPKHGECYINHKEVTETTKLNQGDFIQLGEAITFRFNHPKEALRLKQVENHLPVPAVRIFNSPHHNRKLMKQQEETLEMERKKFEMQKAKIEEEFSEKALLVQMELEQEREKAKSEKEKYENEKVKLEHERKKLEQLQMEIWEREGQNANPIDANKHSSNSNYPLNNKKLKNTDKSLNANNSLSSNKDTNDSPSGSPDIPSDPISTSSQGLVTGNMSTTVLNVSSKEQAASSEMHESIHSLQQAPVLTNTELIEREKQLLLRQEKLDAMQAQLNGKLSGNHVGLDTNASDVLQFISEKDNIEQQRILLERAKFSADSKESALRGLEEHKKLEAALSDIKTELKISATNKENYETLKEENELIMKEKSKLQERVVTLEEKLSKKRDQQLRRKSGGGGGAKDSKTRRRSTHMDVFGVDIIRYISRGSGLHHHYVFEVKLRLGKEQWSVYRRYEQFSELHKQMKMKYPELEALAFPPADTKWFKWFKRSDNEEFLKKRQKDLELYLQSFFAVCASIPHCPLADTEVSLSSNMLAKFHTFFAPNIMESTLPPQMNTDLV